MQVLAVRQILNVLPLRFKYSTDLQSGFARDESFHSDMFLSLGLRQFGSRLFQREASLEFGLRLGRFDSDDAV